MANEYRILIVIPCLNEIKHIEKLVTRLIQQTENLNKTIVIADGGSTDGTIDVVQKLCATHTCVKLLSNPKRIQSAGVNLAVEIYGNEADLMIRMDAHAHYPEDFCTALLDDYHKSGAQSVVIGLDTVGHNGFQQAVALIQNSKLGNGGSAHRTAIKEAGQWVDHGHHALISIESFKKTSGYDESFIANEDAEFDVRFSKLGYKIWLSGSTYMTYYPRATAHKLYRQYYNYGRGRARTIMLHRVIPKIRQIIPVGVFPSVLILPLMIWLPIAAIPFLLWFTTCLILGFLIGVKSKAFHPLMAPFAAMIMHFAWSVGFCASLVKEIFSPTRTVCHAFG